ncbi:hypothetical protein, partial [Mycobacterium sp. 1423905.2]|uniref:hypothetical protein n=1 Tax=Mycobacterium sp. 1423905.2 TaxID=1856859 RepID=UPI001C12B533
MKTKQLAIWVSMLAALCVLAVNPLGEPTIGFATPVAHAKPGGGGGGGGGDGGNVGNGGNGGAGGNGAAGTSGA